MKKLYVGRIILNTGRQVDIYPIGYMDKNILELFPIKRDS